MGGVEFSNIASSMCCTILITSSSERGSIRRASSLGRLGLLRLGRLGLD